jgi:hypothetical protein
MSSVELVTKDNMIKCRLKLGHLYYYITGASNLDVICFVVVGNMLHSYRGKVVRYPAVLSFDTGLLKPEKAFDTVRSGKYKNEVELGTFRHPNKKYDTLWDCGKFVDESSLNLWITQLKLSGVFKGEIFSNCYIGEWKKREKLSCVKECIAGELYVKEELAYLRDKGQYAMQDVLWYYAGMKEYDGVKKFVWYSMEFWQVNDFIAFLRNGKVYPKVKTHVLKNQYKDMVTMVDTNNLWKNMITSGIM